MPNSFSTALRKRPLDIPKGGAFVVYRRKKAERMIITLCAADKKGVLLIGWSYRACFQCKRSISPYPTEHASFPN